MPLTCLSQYATATRGRVGCSATAHGCVSRLGRLATSCDVIISQCYSPKDLYLEFDEAEDMDVAVVVGAGDVLLVAGEEVNGSQVG